VSLELPELDGVLLEPELGVELELESLLEDLSLEELGVLLEPALGVLLEELLELGLVEEPLLGEELELLEPDIEDGGVPEAPEDEDEDGLDGEVEGEVVLDEDDPAEDLSVERDAPGPPAPLSQPYRPLTATAMGITTNAVFFSKLIGGSSR
jgi:hypothetical protein